MSSIISGFPTSSARSYGVRLRVSLTVTLAPRTKRRIAREIKDSIILDSSEGEQYHPGWVKFEEPEIVVRRP